MPKRTVCLDLDGVLAQYDGWKGEDVIGDPLPGAKEFCERLTQEGYHIAVFSTRPVSFVWPWLRKHIVTPAMDIGAYHDKPPALVYIDDRGFRFTGDWEAAYQAIAERPWWQTTPED